jgi:hypothetical protein
LYAALTLVAEICVRRPRAGIVVMGPLNSSTSANVSCTNPLRRAIEAQGGHQAFELQMRVVHPAVDHPLAENFRDDLANPLGANALLAGSNALRIGPGLDDPPWRPRRPVGPPRAGADQPPLSMQPYLAQSSRSRLSPSVSGFLGAGT